MKFSNIIDIFSNLSMIFRPKRKLHHIADGEKEFLFLKKQGLSHRAVIRIDKAHITASFGVVLVGNQRLLVVFAIIGEFQLRCRDIAINNGSGVIIQDIHLELHCRIQLLQFLQNSIADVFH